MFCPECGGEFPNGLTECPECDVPLLAGTPEQFNPAELVVVLETNERIHLAMAKGLLEQAGIPFFVGGQIATLVQDVDGFLRKWTSLQVPRDCEEEAREILEQLGKPVAGFEYDDIA
jgi:Putative prokaryotic signal transducing protein